jgi:hypothetical protein
MSKKLTCLVCDMDGVVADSSHRILKHINPLHFVNGDFTEYYRGFYHYGLDESTSYDPPILEGIEMLKGMVDLYNPDDVLFLTARGNSGRKHTLNWIRKNIYDGFSSSLLIMNQHPAQSDPDWVFDGIHFNQVAYKETQIQELRHKYDIVLAIDDHPSIIAMYNRLGVPNLGVKYDNVDCVSLTTRTDNLHNS